MTTKLCEVQFQYWRGDWINHQIYTKKGSGKLYRVCFTAKCDKGSENILLLWASEFGACDFSLYHLDTDPGHSIDDWIFHQKVLAEMRKYADRLDLFVEEEEKNKLTADDKSEANDKSKV